MLPTPRPLLRRPAPPRPGALGPAALALVLVLQVLLGGAAIAQAIPPRPSPPRLVNDYAGLLSAAEQGALERKLVAYNDSASTQIAVVIEQTSGGAAAMDVAQGIGEAWGVGRRGLDNGVVLYVALAERDVAIATGYGSEGGLTDAASGVIIRRVIAPRFREGQYYAGLDAATDAVMAALRGEFAPPPRPAGGGSPAGGLALALVLLVLFVFVASALAQGGGGGPPSGPPGARGRSGARPRRRSGPGVVIIPGGWGGGGFGGGSGGGGFGGGGFGGGGFGGFGGGGFGGGGASGGW